MLEPDQQIKSGRLKRRLKVESAPAVLLGIFLVAFCAHFILFPQFGLYEDDYILTLPVMKWSASELPGHLWAALAHPMFGRPINFFFRWLIFFFTVRDGNLQPGYLVSLFLVCLNGYLFFLLLKRQIGFRAGFVGTIFYLLYPVDTSRQILMHQTDLHLGATILLTAFLFYQNGRVVLSFVVAALSLLVWEGWCLPFLAAPLIFPRQNRISIRDLLLHTVLFFSVVGLVFLGRNILGEQRAQQMLGQAGQLPGRILAACTIGPLISVQGALLRPIDAISHAEPYGYLLGVVCALYLGLVLWLSRLTKREATRPAAEPPRLLSIFLGGILAWSFSYFLSYRSDYYPPVVTIGRLSAVHAAGTFGAATCFAVCFKMVYRALRTRFFWPLVIALSIYFGSLVAFGVHVQAAEYVASREKQKDVWKAIIRQIPDLQDGDVVLFEASPDRDVMPITSGFPPFGTVNYFPPALPYFVKFPKAWHEIPRVFGVWPGCEFEDTPLGRRLHTPVWAPYLWPVIRDGRFIYLRVESGQLRRVDEPVDILGRMFRPKAEPSQSENPLRLSKLFQNIFAERDSDQWFTVKDARNYPP